MKISNPSIRRAAIGVGMLAIAAAISSLIVLTGPDGDSEPQVEKAWPITVLQANPGELQPCLLYTSDAADE